MNAYPQTIKDLFEYASLRFNDKPCIKYVENGCIIAKSYSELYADSIAEAKHLLSVLPGQSHVAIIGKTSYRYLTYFNAVFFSGNTAVPLGTDYPEDDILYCVNKADVNAVIYDDSVSEKINAIPFDGSIRLINLSEEHSPVTDEALPENSPDDLAMIMFTSGTTGDRKGVMLSSGAITSNVMFREMSYEGDNVALNVLPMHHIFCFSCDWLKNVKDGVTVCLNGDTGNTAANLLRFEPSVIRLVPMMTESLLRKARIMKRRFPELTDREAAEKVFGKRLRSIIVSGAYFKPSVAEEYEKMGISVRQGYGMTETGPRIAVPNGKTDSRSAGAVIDICEIRIADGEIQVKSPSLMTGYYKDEEATKEVFTPDGWFMTGDTGYIGEGRCLYITGRKKNLIILSNGENISPEEIEKKLGADGTAEEILVYGENDRITAEVYVSPDFVNTAGRENAENHIRALVEEYNMTAVSEKVIAQLKFRNDPFEKTSSGKIKRNQIIF